MARDHLLENGRKFRWTNIVYFTVIRHKVGYWKSWNFVIFFETSDFLGVWQSLIVYDICIRNLSSFALCRNESGQLWAFFQENFEIIIENFILTWSIYSVNFDIFEIYVQFLELSKTKIFFVNINLIPYNFQPIFKL
jgi:hypothetical protein